MPGWVLCKVQRLDQRLPEIASACTMACTSTSSSIFGGCTGLNGSTHASLYVPARNVHCHAMMSMGLGLRVSDGSVNRS